MQSGLSPFLVNIVPLQNIITNTSGLDPTTILSNSVAQIQSMVNTSNLTVYTDTLSAFTTGGAIHVTSPIYLCNVGIYSNGVSVTENSNGTPISTIQGVSGFVRTNGTVDLGIQSTTILEIGSTGNVYIRGGSEMSVSSMTFLADLIKASTINVGGTCFAQNFVTLSDMGVKSQISTLTQTRGFEGIGTYTFKYSEDGKEEIGLLAQEVENVYPECVTVGPGDVKYIKYNAVVSLLLGAVRNLEKRVRVLEGCLDKCELSSVKI